MEKNLGFTLIGAAGLGAGLMYLLDPAAGSRRRAMARAKAVHLLNQSENTLNKTSRDVRNRTYGLVAEIRSRFEDESVDDDALIGRIRARIGRVVSHPSAIQVTAETGNVTLRGLVLEDEVKGLLRAVRQVRGVHDVDNRLEIHDQPGQLPSLQGGRKRIGSEYGLLQSNWPPATRLFVGLGGAGLTAAGLRNGGLIGAILVTLGGSLTTLAITNTSFRRSMSLGRMENIRSRLRMVS